MNDFNLDDFLAPESDKKDLSENQESNSSQESIIHSEQLNFDASKKEGSHFEESGNTDDFQNIAGDQSDSTTEANDVEQDDEVKWDEKEAVEDILNQSAPMLKRHLITSIAVSFLVIVMLLTFVLPAFKKKKTTETNIGQAQEHFVPNFETMVEKEAEVPAETANFENSEVDFQNIEQKLESEVVGTAPVDLPPQPQPQPQQRTGGSGGYRRPDTRRNPLQKNISGIKGLSKNNAYQNSVTEHINKNNPLTFLQQAKNLIPKKEDYIKQLLGMQSASVGQTTQQINEAFYGQNRGNASSGEFLSQCSVWQGTIIPAVLITGINTDLPGDIIARVTTPVFSSQNGRFLLIPQGTLLFANYSSSIAYGQNRVQVGWTQMIRPDGYMMNLGNMQGVNSEGQTGYKGSVNNHLWAFIKGLTLTTVLAFTTSDLNTMSKKIDPSMRDGINGFRNPVEKVTNKVIDRYLDIPPTITVKSGLEINILTNQTIILPPVLSQVGY